MYYTIKNYIKFLSRNKVISVVNIIGFAISMTVLFILIAFIIGEKNINSSYPNKENIYRIVRTDEKNTLSTIPTSLYDDTKLEIPEIDKFGMYCFRKLPYKYNDNVGMLDLAGINDDFLEIFSIDYISKLTNTSLKQKENAIITESLSKKLFNNKNPIGETISIMYKPYTIIGIIKDLPKNSSFHFDVALSYNEMYVGSIGHCNKDKAMENHVMMNAFLLLKQSSNAKFVDEKISGMLNKWGAFKKSKLSIEPFNDVYFNAVQNDQMEHAYVKLIYLLFSITLIIIFMAIFNYINITISSSYNRLKEIGIKRTAGVSKKGIFIQLITESLFVSSLAMLIAIVLSFISVDLFSQLLGKEIVLNSIIKQPLFIIIILSVIIITGLLGGIYPAFIFSKFSPLELINNLGKMKKQSSGKFILGFQFVVSIILITSLIFIQKQLNFIKYRDLGFDTEQIVYLSFPSNIMEKGEIFKEELLKYPEIIDVAGGNPILITGSASIPININGEKKIIESKYIPNIDKNFLSMFNIKLTKGRNIRETDNYNVCLINEHMYKELGWKNLDGKEFGSESVIGVVADFNYKSLHNKVGNLVLSSGSSYFISIKISKNTAQALNIIKEAYNKFKPDIAPKITFYDDSIQAMYQKEETQFKAIVMFAVIAIIIAALGLFGLSVLMSLRKTKEIGIRKINGANIKDVVLLLNRKFIFTIIISFVIASPIAYYVMNKWLESFAYKTSLSWWGFAVSGLLALLIALITVSWQSFRAAKGNPVEALRYE